jgi:hypothetical protein
LQFACTYICNYNFFLLRHITHLAADAEAKKKAAEEEASKRAAAEAAAGL